MSSIQERWLEEEDVEFIKRSDKMTGEAASSLAAFIDNTETTVSSERVRKFHPFGDGLRSCVGQNLARMNVPTAIALFVSNFHLKLDESVSSAFSCRICWLTILPVASVGSFYLVSDKLVSI